MCRRALECARRPAQPLVLLPSHAPDQAPVAAAPAWQCTCTPSSWMYVTRAVFKWPFATMAPSDNALRVQVSLGDTRIARILAEDLSSEKRRCSAPHERAMAWQCRSLQVKPAKACRFVLVLRSLDLALAVYTPAWQGFVQEPVKPWPWRRHECAQVLDALAVTPRYREVLSLGAAAGQERAHTGIVVSLRQHETAHESGPESADKPAAKASRCLCSTCTSFLSTSYPCACARRRHSMMPACKDAALHGRWKIAVLSASVTAWHDHWFAANLQGPGAPQQLAVHAECTCLRAVYIHRFLLDCAHFGRELCAGVADARGFAMARAAHVAWPGTGSSAEWQSRCCTPCEVPHLRSPKPVTWLL